MAEHTDKQKWIELATKQLRGRPLEDLDWPTPEGINVKPMYTAEDLQGMEHLNSLPGFPPYTRGPMATMYAGRPWTVRQYAGFSTAKEVTDVSGRGVGMDVVQSTIDGLGGSLSIESHTG